MTRPDFLAYRHPVLAVPCPDCQAAAGAWCKRPSGHKASDLHKARKTAADEVWIAAGRPPTSQRGPMLAAELRAILETLGLSQAGLPVGLQIVGPRHRDDLVLQAAHAFERARPWAECWPSLEDA